MTDLPDRPVRVTAVELPVDTPLDQTPAERAVIEAHFDAVRAANPKLWNGAFFLFDRVAWADDGVFAARARPTDFATFMHWRATPTPDPRVVHVFPVAAVTTTDDRLLVGVMGPGTANPGRVYPPSGSFDPLDVIDGRLDPVASMVRELAEEVGIDIADLTGEAGFTIYPNGPRRFAVIRPHRAAVTSAEWTAAIAAHVAADPHQELSGFRFLRFDERLPDGVAPYYLAPLLADLAILHRR